MVDDDEGYRDYVRARLEPLRRTAFLLCGDWHTADDVVSVALAKLYRHWRRVVRADCPDAYVRRTLVNAWLDERRRPWRREHVTAVLPEAPVLAPDSEQRMVLLACLDRMPPRQRAVLVLRYFCDLSVGSGWPCRRCRSTWTR